MIPYDVTPEEVLARKLDSGTFVFVRDGEVCYYDGDTRGVLPADHDFLEYVARDAHWVVNIDRMAEFRGRLV